MYVVKVNFGEMSRFCHSQKESLDKFEFSWCQMAAFGMRPSHFVVFWNDGTTPMIHMAYILYVYVYVSCYLPIYWSNPMYFICVLICFDIFSYLFSVWPICVLIEKWVQPAIGANTRGKSFNQAFEESFSSQSRLHYNLQIIKSSKSFSFSSFWFHSSVHFDLPLWQCQNSQFVRI